MEKEKPNGNVPGIIPIEVIARRIFLVRGQKVILDRDLAELYQVSTGNLNLAVRRNAKRFPSDFMFQLTDDEYENLILQTAISSWGGRRHMPYAFIEQGVAMLSSVLKSERAVQVNIVIMRVFVKLRAIIADNAELSQRLDALEREQKRQGMQVKEVFAAIKELLAPPPEEEKPPIGFRIH